METSMPKGIQVVPATDFNEYGSGGRSGEMRRQSAVEAGGIWVGTSTLAPGYVSSWHHHGDQTTIVYIVSGSFNFIVGNDREVIVGHVGDMVVIPPETLHCEDNSVGGEESLCVVVRTGAPPIVVNVEQ